MSSRCARMNRHVPMHGCAYTQVCAQSVPFATRHPRIIKSQCSGSPHKLLMEWKIVQPLRKRAWQFLKELNTELHTTQRIPIPGIYPGEMNTYVHTETCTQILTAALFIMVSNRKQPKCPSTGEWRNNVVYRHNVITKYWSPWQRGWTWKMLCSVKEAKPKTPQIMWSHL